MGAQGLDYQLAAVEFTKGLDTKTQAKLRIPGKWSKLDNLTLTADGTPRRRDGVARLVAQTGNGLATYNNQLLAISGGDVFSVAKATSTSPQVSGRHSYVGIAKTEVQRSVGTQDGCDVAVGFTSNSSTKLTCYVWRDKTGGTVVNGLNVSLVDEATGAFLIQNQTLRASATAATPRVVFCPNVMNTGGTFFIFYIDGTSLYCRAIRTSAPTTLGAEVALITSANLANLNFDACAFATNAGGDTTVFVAYGWADGVTSVRTIKVALVAGLPAISIGPTNTLANATLAIGNLCGLAICAYNTSGTVMVVAYGFGTSYRIQLDNGVTVTAAAAAIGGGPTVNNPCHVCACLLANGQIQVFFDQRSSWGTNASLPISSVVIDSAAGVVQGPGTIIYSSDFAGAATDPAGPRGPYISGKPFASGAGCVLPVEILENYQGLGATRVSNNQQSTFFLVDVQGFLDASLVTATGVVIGHALYGAVGVATINNVAPSVFTPCSTPALGDGSFAYACTERTLLSFVGGFNVSPTGVVRLTLTPNTTEAPLKAQLGESTYLNGGFVTNYDGARVNEHPFMMFPEGISLELVAAGGAMTAGVHQVVVIAECVDNAGQRHQSAPCLAVSMTVAANDRIRVRVPTLHMTQLGTAIKLVAYVTQAGGITFNRVATTALGSAGTDNNPAAASVTLPLIDAADATYAQNELLYTQPNQNGTTLPNLGPPPCSAVWTHGNRLFFDQADQPGSIGYSQLYANNLGLQFNPSLTLPWPVGEGGEFKTGASLDEKSIVFCSKKIYVSYGSGPNAAGNFSNYSELQGIPSDVGCSDARSVLEMPMGIIFKSAKGFYLLGRDLQVRFIGEGVEEFNAYEITSAVLLGDRQECRFGTNTSTHPQLVYSYSGDGQWSTNSYQDTYVTRDAVWWPVQGQYMAIDGSYGIQTDQAGKYDALVAGANQPIVWTARTSFLHVGEIGGFQRVRWSLLTGTAESTAQPTSELTWNIYLNDVLSTAAYSFVADLSQLASTSPRDAVDMRHKIEKQKSKSIAFEWIDTPIAADAVAGTQLDGIQAVTLEVGRRRGTAKLPASQGVS